jgi:hypothetical protein
MSVVPRRLTALILFALFILCVYRARTQNLVIDEAWVFRRFVNQPLVEMATSWDACNHVLHTLLMKVFRGLLGTGEIVLRLPTLIGAALYLTAVYRLTMLLFSGWRQPVVASLLVLHPLVVDLMVAARGYGLALGLFTWSLYFVVRYWMGLRDPRLLIRAGVLGGLSVAANLTFAVPVAALGLTMLAMDRSWYVIDRYCGPALVIATLIVIVPLLRAQPQDFYFGEPGPLDTLRRMYDTVLKSENAAFTAFGWTLSRFAGPVLALVFLLISGTAVVAIWYRRYENFARAPFVLCAGTLALSGLLLCAMGARGVPYPSGRTGLYLIPLFTMSVLLLLKDRRVVTALAVPVALIYVSENDPRYFVDWRYDADTREVLSRLDQDRERRGVPAPVTLAVPSTLSLSTEYYQLRKHLGWMKIEPFESEDSAYVLFDSRNAEKAVSPRFEIVANMSLSGATLARRVQ